MGKPKAIPHEEEVRAVIRHELEKALGDVEAVETTDVDVELLDADVYVPAAEELGSRYNQDDLNALVSGFNAMRDALIGLGVLLPDPEPNVELPANDEGTEELAAAPAKTEAPTPEAEVPPTELDAPTEPAAPETPVEDDSTK